MYLIYKGSIYNYLIVIPLKNECGLAILTFIIQIYKKNWLFTDKNTICHHHWKSSDIEKDYTWLYFKP